MTYLTVPYLEFQIIFSLHFVLSGSNKYKTENKISGEYRGKNNLFCYFTFPVDTGNKVFTEAIGGLECKDIGETV